MTRRKLIFFAGADPSTDPGPAAAAYHFATVAARAGLEAEVRLARDSVKVAIPGAIAFSPPGAELQEKVRDSAQAPYLISF